MYKIFMLHFLSSMFLTVSKIGLCVEEILGKYLLMNEMRIPSLFCYIYSLNS